MSKDPAKTINVHLEGGKADLDRKDREIERLEKILDDLATNALEEKKSELAQLFPERREEIESLSVNELNAYELSLYKNQTPTKRKPPSKGSVSLLQPQSNNPMLKEWSDPLSMVRYIYDTAKNPNDPHYEQMKRVKKQLQSKLNLDNFPRKTEMYSDRLEEMATQELGRSFGHEAYTEWIQQKAREAEARRK